MIIQSPKKKCPGCGFEGGVYEFAPAIEISEGDFRIFHLYAGMRGPLYCNQCKRKHLLNIADQKNLNEEQKEFLRKSIGEKAKKYSVKK